MAAAAHVTAAEWKLAAHPSIPRGLPVLVCILDGWGENEVRDEWNAVHSAATPTVDALRAAGAHSGRWRSVKAHGPAVGLPTEDDMGNSEVGHNALGAGQLIDQGARLVDRALADGSLFTHDGWEYVSGAFANNTVHFLGLLSSGGVHSRANQLYQRARPCRGALPLRAGGTACSEPLAPECRSRRPS
jgi:2,3-bisphosphoglycerate-independent phosphoglycerate mutase